LFEALFKYSLEDYARGELVYLGQWPDYIFILLGALAVAGITALLYLRRGQVRPHQLAAIGLLQLAMVVVVLWALGQPTLATDRLRDGENTIALVLDSSASMHYGAPQSRFVAAQQNLAKVMQDGGLPGLSVRYYELADRSRSVDSFVDSQPDGNATNFVASLTAILDEARFRPLAALVLSSDGADTAGGLDPAALAALAAYGVPIHTIAVGDETIADDIELEDVAVPDTALPGSTVSARVTLRHDAPGSATIKVYDGDELTRLVPVEMTADAGTSTAWIEIELGEAGPHELKFSVEGEADETELRNNSRTALVNVADRVYHVLYYEGEPRWEYKFLRRAVSGDDDLQLASLLRVSPNKFYRQGIDTPEQLQEGFPASRAELFRYDALIIGSVEAASLTDEQQQLVRDFVSIRGGSLLMLAGPSGLGNGGWGQSALADVLPVRLAPSATDTFHRKKAPVALTPQGAASRILRLEPDDDLNRAAWQELPEIADYQLTGELKPAAVALLDATTETGRIPLLVSQPYGRGHAWILATGGTWRWQMSLPLEDLKHETFWRQLMRALVADTPDKVSLDAVARPGEGRVDVHATFRDDAYLPLSGVSVTAVASHESGESMALTLQPGDEPGSFGAEFEPTQPGIWYFEAVAGRDGQVEATSRGSLLYETGQAEYFNFRANPGFLERLSTATGGVAFRAGNLAGLTDRLRYASAGITETEYRSIWDAPVVFLLLVLLKSGEWLLRRRWSSI